MGYSPSSREVFSSSSTVISRDKPRRIAERCLLVGSLESVFMVWVCYSFWVGGVNAKV